MLKRHCVSGVADLQSDLLLVIPWHLESRQLLWNFSITFHLPSIRLPNRQPFWLNTHSFNTRGLKRTFL